MAEVEVHRGWWGRIALIISSLKIIEGTQTMPSFFARSSLGKRGPLESSLSSEKSAYVRTFCPLILLFIAPSPNYAVTLVKAGLLVGNCVLVYHLLYLNNGWCGMLNGIVKTWGIVETINTVSTWICKMANPLRCKSFPQVLQRVYCYLLQFIVSCWSVVFFSSLLRTF